MAKGAFLMFVTVTEFFQNILKMNSDGQFEFTLGDCYILVCSRDLVTDTIRSAGDANDFQSRYSNVEFISGLLPSVHMMEYATTNGLDTFASMYVAKLYEPSRMGDIISICDLVVKRDTPIFILISSMDLRTSYPSILREFIKEEFGLQGYLMEDLEGKTPDEINEIVRQIGDKDKIIAAIDDHIDKLLRETDKEYFLNALADDVEQVYREVLDSKSVDELKEMAAAKMIFISKRDDKARIIDKLIRRILTADKA